MEVGGGLHGPGLHGNILKGEPLNLRNPVGTTDRQYISLFLDDDTASIEGTIHHSHPVNDTADIDPP